MNIYGYECGKQTEKDIKQFLGLPAEVAKKGEIDAVYRGTTIEIKRGACALYVGKRFNRYRNAHNAVNRLYADAIGRQGNAMTRSKKVIYSIDGTIENAYIIGTKRFLSFASQSSKLYKVDGNKKMLVLVPNKDFIENIIFAGRPLAQWKEKQDRPWKTE